MCDFVWSLKLLMQGNGKDGIIFRVWAEKAQSVSAIGNFNGWKKNIHYLEQTQRGIWEGFLSLQAPDVVESLRFEKLRLSSS